MLIYLSLNGMLGSIVLMCCCIFDLLCFCLLLVFGLSCRLIC